MMSYDYYMHHHEYLFIYIYGETSLYNKNIWIATNEDIPNTPRNPDTIIVNKLIGICNPIAPPKTFKKNNRRNPIPNFTVLCAIKRVGFTGAPMNNSRTINAIIIKITIVGLICFTPFTYMFFVLHMSNNKIIEHQQSRRK